MIRVAAYCRVSTDRADQVNSFESQKRYFKECIEKTAGWSLHEIYADEGITGTSTRKRAAFLRMLEDAKNGAFDLILTKEVSRFARNTVDALSYVRELRRFGIGVIFAGDGINTLDPDAEFRLAIMASVAQEESRKTSARVKWGQQRRMEAGVVFGHRLLGYDLSGGNLTVNEHEAQLVRRIFCLYTENGMGTHTIAHVLRDEGVPSPGGGAWSPTAVLRILKNEKYCGDLVQKKSFTPDYLTHQKAPNRGEESFVILRDHHAPIIPRAVFEDAQRRLAARPRTNISKTGSSNRHPYSGKIVCGVCGRRYVARFKTRKDGERYESWRCAEGAKNGVYSDEKRCGCLNPSLRTQKIDRILQKAWCALGVDTAQLAADVTEIVRKVLAGTAAAIPDPRGQILDRYRAGCLDREECLRRLSTCSPVQTAGNTPASEEDAAHMEKILSFAEAVLAGIYCDRVFYREVLREVTVFSAERIEVSWIGIEKRAIFRG